MPSWNWDEVLAETAGDVHESTTNTDHDNAAVYKQGFQVASPYKSASLVGYYPLHEDSGTTAYDFSGNNNDGSISGATVNVAALLGATGYSFDGTDDTVTLGNIYGTPENGYSISVWINPDSVTSGNRTWTMAEDASTRWRVIFRKNGDDLYLYHRPSGGAVSISAANVLSAGSWQHVVATYDGTNATLYLNGSAVAGPSSLSAPESNTDNWVLGYQASAADEYYDGDMTTVHIYDTELSSSEVTDLYNVVATSGQWTSTKKTT